MKRLFAVAVLAAASSPTFAADLGLGPQQQPSNRAANRL
jgi:hypothetical protein